MINLKLIKDAGFAGKAAPPDAGPPGPSRGKGKGGGIGGGKKGGVSTTIRDTATLKCWYPMDTITTATSDATGQLSDLAVSSTVVTTTGKVGNAAYFDAAINGYLIKQDPGQPYVGDFDWTICFWFNAGVIANQDALISNRIGAGTDPMYIQFNSASTIQLVVNTSGGYFTADNPTTLSTGTTYMCRAYFDATNNNIGISIDEGTPTETNIGANTILDGSLRTFIVGGWGSNVREYTGWIDELALWWRLLTDAEALYYKEGQTY